MLGASTTLDLKRSQKENFFLGGPNKLTFWVDGPNKVALKWSKAQKVVQELVGSAFRFLFGVGLKRPNRHAPKWRLKRTTAWSPDPTWAAVLFTVATVSAHRLLASATYRPRLGFRRTKKAAAVGKAAQGCLVVPLGLPFHLVSKGTGVQISKPKGCSLLAG